MGPAVAKDRASGAASAPTADLEPSVRRVLGGVAALTLLATAVPALASGPEVETEPAGDGGTAVVVTEDPVEPELLLPCVTSRPTISADGGTGTVATPAPPFGEESAQYVLDLAGLPVGSTAGVNVAMSWAVPTNDFDLEAFGGTQSGDSMNIQPLDPALEEVYLAGLKHCAVITATAINFLAPVVVDTLTLDFGVFPKIPQ
jgi:hypothetical protein